MVRCRCALLAAATGLVAVACDSLKPRPPAVFVAPATLTLEDGQSAKITATLRNPKSRVVRWSSSNAAIATVDALGNVTGVTNGTANVVVKMADDSTINAMVPVTVSGPAVASVRIAPSVATVYVGTALRMTAQLRASDGRVLSGRAVTWATPNASVADVSTIGLVRGIGPGGPISVTATSEGQTAASLVRVAYAAEACPVVTPIALGQRVDGRLALGDCEFTLDESYVDVYEITLAAPATVQIDMVSADLDSYLGLFDVGGTFIAEDDDTGGGRNAQIVRQLSAGKYRIWANTTAGGVSGAYTLTAIPR